MNILILILAIIGGIYIISMIEVIIVKLKVGYYKISPKLLLYDTLLLLSIIVFTIIMIAIKAHI